MKKSIAIIILDACRYDYLSCYNKRKNTSPIIDKLAKKSEVYEKAYTLGTHSVTSLPKFFTGNPDEKRVGFKKGTLIEMISKKTSMFLPLTIRKKFLFIKKFFKNSKKELNSTLIKQIDLKRCCISANPHYSFGLEKDFDIVERAYLEEDWLNPRTIIKKALRFLEKNKEGFLLLCHFMQPHDPYIAPFSKEKFSEEEMTKIDKYTEKGGKISPDKTEKIRKAYENNVKWIDKELEPLLNKLEKLNSEVIITADHGELLGEYGRFRHPMEIKCEELSHIPLIWFKPKGKKSRNKEKIHLNNVLPMIIKKFN